MPLYALNFRFFLRKIRANSATVRAKMDVLFGHLKEKLDGTLVIKALAREPAEVDDFAAQLADAPRLPGARQPALGGLLEPERGDQRDGHGRGLRRGALRGPARAG